MLGFGLEVSFRVAVAVVPQSHRLKPDSMTKHIVAYLSSISKVTLLASRVRDGLLRFLTEVFVDVEPLDLPVMSLFIRRYLGRWKAEGLVLSYETGAERLGKHHYRIVVDLDLTKKQAERAVAEGFDRVLRR